MSLFKFADLIAIKYAALDEAEVRRAVLDLWNLTNNKTYSILREITEAQLKGAPKNEKEQNAKRGHSFVRQVVHIIDLLKANLNNVDSSIIEAKLKEVINLIEENADGGGRGTVDFPDLTDYVFLIGGNTRNLNQSDKRYIEAQYSKIRTILTKIHSSADSIVTKLMKLRGESPEKDYRHHQRQKLVPRRSPLYKGDAVDFLRQWGPAYGLKDYDAWQVAFENDPVLKEQITTVINSLNRGHTPVDAGNVKMQIAEIMRSHEQRKSNNSEALEAPVLPTHNFVSPQLKKERMIEQQEIDSVKEEEQRRLQEMVNQRDEANKRHQLENQPSEEDLNSKYSSLRLTQILKRYQ